MASYKHVSEIEIEKKSPYNDTNHVTDAIFNQKNAADKNSRKNDF